MKLRLYLLPFLCFLFIPGSLFSQSNRPTISNEPAWISKNNIDYNITSLDKDAADGYIDISIERQVSLADQSEYSRRSIKIISQAGVQNGSQVSVSFDPAFQQLSFHSIKIFRKGEILDRLKLSDIKTVQQEKELTNFVYNGTLDAIMILEDVRQGDIIEYSYTIKGFNPIFKNKYADEFSLAFYFPVYQVYYKMIVPPGRKINIKNVNETIQPVIGSLNGQQCYEWKKNNVAALPLQDYTPSWYDPYPQVLISEYNNWKEVNDWAMELFPVKKVLSSELQKKIKEIENNYSTDEERLETALRFVQDDIRYMGIEMGEHSHRPADPSKVFAQRFGDCKEKTYLLCCMLRAMHIEANPVLINTESEKNIYNFLPAPTDFDHATVRIKLDNIYYWLDPTIAYQRGRIKNLFYPDYQAGLVVSDSTTSLTTIDFRNINYVHVKEYFRVPAMKGDGTLMVTTNYEGNAADNIRNDFNNESITELMTTYQKFYAVYYDKIKADSLTYIDNDSTGIFTTTEYYSLPDFWTVDKKNVSKFSFSAFVINGILSRPKEKNRKMPFSLTFPARYQEESVIDLPQEWNINEEETHLKNKCFVYNSKFYCVNNHVYLKTYYENYKDNAGIEEAPAYFKDLNEYDDKASFELSLGKDEPVVKATSNSSGRNTLLTILVIGFVIGVFVVRRQQK